MAQIRVKRTTAGPTTQTLKPGEIGVIQSKLYFGYATAADTEDLTPIALAGLSINNDFTEINTFRSNSDDDFQILNSSGTKKTYSKADGFLYSAASDADLIAASSNILITRDYVDARIQGLQIKQAVEYSSTTNLTMTYSGGVLTYTSNNVYPTLDGHTLTLVEIGIRLLVKDQTNPAHNGIYTFTQAPDVSTPAQFTRATDADLNTELAKAYVFVKYGSTLEDTGWYTNFPSSGTIGSTSVSWYQFSSAGTYIADEVSLTKEGNIFRIKGSTSGYLLMGNGTSATPVWYNKGVLTISTGLTAAGTYNPTTSQTISLTDIAAGDATAGAIRYLGTAATAAGKFDSTTTTPSATTRLNYQGELWATAFRTPTLYLYSAGYAGQVNITTLTSGTSTNAIIPSIGASDYYFIMASGVTTTAGRLPLSTTVSGIAAWSSTSIGTMAYEASTSFSTTGHAHSTLTFNDSGTGGSSTTTYNGTATKTISYNTLGAAPTSHATTATTYGAGTNTNYGHVKLVTSVDTGGGAMSHVGNTSNPNGAFNNGATTPSNTQRMNYEGYFYATKFYGDGANLTNIVASSIAVGTTDASATYYLIMSSATGNVALYTDNTTTPLSYNPNTNYLNVNNITSIATIAAVYNVTASSVSAFGNATTLNIGHNVGATTSNSTTNIVTSTNDTGIKTINIGTGGANTSTTSISIGSTVNGTITLNGATIVGGNSTLALFNATSTSISAFGAATTLNIGATTGTISFSNPRIDTETTSLTLFNDTATTITAFGAATQITMGTTASSTTTINSPNILSGTATVALFNATSTSISAFGAATTLNLATNAVGKTLNIGTGATASHTTTIALGSTLGTFTTSINGVLKTSSATNTAYSFYADSSTTSNLPTGTSPLKFNGHIYATQFEGIIDGGVWS